MESFDVVVRRRESQSYRVTIAETLDHGWARGVPALLASTGNVLLCLDAELPLALKQDIISEIADACPGTLSSMELSAGEQLKGMGGLKPVLRKMADVRLRRDGLVVAAGGGSLGDLAGFAAAIWHRGTPWVVLPTTLLAQVDSAIGGKVGVNMGGLKNMVGAFHQPVGVFCAIPWLSSLTSTHFQSGLGELVKYGLGMDEYTWDLLWNSSKLIRARDSAVLKRLVRRAISLKAEYVAFDERDKGRRRHLNLGHTFAHALEGAGYQLEHGQAVALGLVAATRLSVALGMADQSLEHQLLDLLSRLGLPRSIAAAPMDKAFAAMEADKKHQEEHKVVILPVRIGQSIVYEDPPLPDLEQALESLFLH